jgi:nucleoside phosphorylase
LASPSFVFADTAILVALPSEQSALSREVRVVGQPVEIAQHKISIGYHKGEKLYIVRTGAGNLNSAMVTQALLTRYRIDRVISIGVAGNLNDEWKVGDLLVVTNVVNHQEGKETPGGFEVKQEPSAFSRIPTEVRGVEEQCGGDCAYFAGRHSGGRDKRNDRDSSTSSE